MDKTVKFQEEVERCFYAIEELFYLLDDMEMAYDEVDYPHPDLFDEEWREIIYKSSYSIKMLLKKVEQFNEKNKNYR